MRVTLPLAALALACQPSSVPTPRDVPSPAPEAGPGAPPPTRDAVTPKVPNGAPEVTVTAAAPRVRLREALRLTVTVRNSGTSALVIPLTSGCLTDFEVLDARGALLGGSEQMCTQAMGSRSVPAGGSVSDSFVWTPGGPGNAGSAPGTYQLRGVLLRQGGPVRSAPITIEVLAAG